MIDPDIDANLKLERESLDPAVRKKASQDLNKIMGSKAEAIWANWVVWAQHRQEQRARARSFVLENGKTVEPVYFPGFLNMQDGVEVLSRRGALRAHR